MTVSSSNRSYLYHLRRGITDLWFVVSMVVAMTLLAILLGYHAGDPGWSTSGGNAPVQHWLGFLGAYLADVFLSVLGYGAYFFAFGIALLGWQGARKLPLSAENIAWKLLALLFTTIALCGVLALHWPKVINSVAVTAGGIVGQKMSIELLKLLPVMTVMLVYTVPLLLGLTLLLDINWLRIAQGLGALFLQLFLAISVFLRGGKGVEAADSLAEHGDPKARRRELKQRLNPKAAQEPSFDLNWSDYKAQDVQTATTGEVENNDGATMQAEDGQCLASSETQLTDSTDNPFVDFKAFDGAAEEEGDGEACATEDKNSATEEDLTTEEEGLTTEEEGLTTEEEGLTTEEEGLTTEEEDLTTEKEDLIKRSNDSLLGFNDLGSEPPYDASDSAVSPLESNNDTPTNDALNLSLLKVRLPNDLPRQSFDDADYVLPPLSLLSQSPPSEADYSDEELDEMAALVETALADYRIDVRVANIELGPVVTRLELELAPGVKVSQVSNLDKDLARSLSVQRVRVVEVIPGKPYIGLEIPNRRRDIVYLRDILESQQYQIQKSPLTLVLGGDITGKPVVANLGKMPHLLVAGTTGSGKSVAINVMLASMLYKASPQELRLILVDPKMLEMSMYEDIPHLLTPVVTDMNDAENALRWAVAEMERRYQLMAALKVRSIDGFNALLKEKKTQGEHVLDPLWNPEEHLGLANQPPEIECLPYIVIVIDELADMMMVVGKKVEELIARIAQKARAAGIHLILATQRPSVDVITGLIKANVPTRIAFQVSSKIDSRTIIDQQGAETLLGHGDMLYAPPGSSMPQRAHGAFISDGEVDRLTAFLREQGEPNYEEAIINPVSPADMGAFGAGEKSDDPEDDPLYDQAVALVQEHNKASISWLQRQLSIGYNRSARIIEAMEAVGIVSAPERGTRKVLRGRPEGEEGLH